MFEFRYELSIYWMAYKDLFEARDSIRRFYSWFILCLTCWYELFLKIQTGETVMSLRFLKDVLEVCSVTLSIQNSHQHGNKLIEWQSFLWCILACHWRKITILGEEIILMMNISYRSKIYSVKNNLIDNQ